MSERYNIKNDNTKTFIYFKPSETNNLEHIKILIEDGGDIDVYPNDEEDTNNSYNNVTDYIYRIITNSRFLCKGLNPEYIIDAFDNGIYVGTYAVDKDGEDYYNQTYNK